MAVRKNQQSVGKVIVKKTDECCTPLPGKIETKGSGMCSYDHLMSQLNNGTPKEGGVKREAKPITVSNTMGKFGKKNSRKRN